MAKKNKIDLDDVTPNDKRKNKKEPKREKKSHGCLSCIVTLVVIFVVLVAGIAGGGIWAWGKYVEPKVGLSISEAFNVLTSLYKANESEIVTNPYSQSDLDDFYTEFKKKTYLSEDSDIDIIDILDAASSSKSEEEESTPMVLAESAPEGTGNEALDALLKSIEFDFSSLATYSGEENILEVTDKQFAALIDSVFQYYITQSAEGETDQSSPLASISQYAQYLQHVSISQIIIESVAGAKLEDVVLTLTIKIDVASLAPELLKNTSVPSFVSGLLPKTIFVSMDVRPNDENGSASVVINQIDKELMDKLVNLLNDVVGGEVPIMQTINNAVKDVVAKLNEVIPISFVDSGCDMKPVEALMNVLDVDLGEAQFLYLIRDFKLPDATAVGVAQYTTQLRNQNVEEFIDDFTAKYGFDNSDDLITTDNVFSSVTSLMQDDAMLEKINLATLNYDSGSYIADNHKVSMSYLAMAGLLNSQLSSGSSEASAFPITILNMSYDQTEGMLEVVIAVDVLESIAGKAEEGSLIAIFAPQILPEQIFIKARLSLTDAEKETEICINNCTKEQTLELLDNLNKLCSGLGIDVSSFNISELTTKLEDSVRENLTKINEKLGTDIEFTSTGCILPSIFETATGLGMLKDESNNPVVDDAQLHDMLKAAYTFEADTVNVSVGAVGFVTELENKYYITTDTLDPSDGAALFNSVTTIKNNFETSIDVNKMATDTTDIDELKPSLSQEELGFLIQSSGKLDNVVSVMKNIKVVSTRITATQMTMQLSGEIQLTGENAKYSVLLPRQVYVNVTVDTALLRQKLEGADVDCASFDIDGMTTEQMNNFFSVATKLGGNEVTAEGVRQTLEDNIYGFMDDIVADRTIDITFGDGVMNLNTTVFDIAISQIYAGELSKPSNVELRSVLQKVNVIPEELSQSNIATDMSRFAEEINSKYYLKTPINTTGDVSEQITTITTKYATMIDGQAMAADTRSVNDGVALKPQASGGELARLLSGDVTISAEGLEHVSMTSLTITSASTMRIVFTANISSESAGKYATLLPSGVAIVVDVDLSKVGTSEVCTAFTINDMDDADLDVFCNLFKIVADKTVTPDDINADASDKVKNKLGEMTAGTQMEYSTTDIDANTQGGTITFSTIYGLAIKNIYSDGVKPSEADFQGMMKALFTLTDVVGQDNINAIDDKMSSEQVSAQYVATPLPHGEVAMEISDRNIAAALLDNEDGSSGVSSALGLGTSDVTYKQVLMFNPDYINATAVKDGFSGMTFESESYMLLTLNIKTSGLMSKTTTLLPESIDVTAFIDIDSTEYTTTLMFNNMTAEQQKILQDIINSNRTVEEGDTTLFDSTDSLKTKIMETEIISIEKVGSLTLDTPIKWTIKDVLDNVVKADGYGVRHSGNTLISGSNYGGFIYVEDTGLTIS
ncbi:MAG: hypothetical protein ACI4MI_00205 [Christensenellales bacterium]